MGVYSGPEAVWCAQTDVGRTHISTKGVVQSGLVLNLDAGVSSSYPGSGTTWTDLSGNGNNGTLTNGPTFNGSNGGSIVFDGVNDYVLSQTNLNFSQGTISVWIYPTEANNNNFFVYSNNNPIFTYSHQLGISASNKLIAYVYDGVGKSSTGTTTISLNNWYYLTFLWLSNSYYRSYINGNLETTASVGTSWVSGSNFWIGSSTGGASGAPQNYFKGNISSLTIHNKALTEQEIQQNFNALRGRFGI